MKEPASTMAWTTILKFFFKKILKRLADCKKWLYLCVAFEKRPVRLGVRTRPFHG